MVFMAASYQLYADIAISTENAVRVILFVCHLALTKTDS